LACPAPSQSSDRAGRRGAELELVDHLDPLAVDNGHARDVQPPAGHPCATETAGQRPLASVPPALGSRLQKAIRAVWLPEFVRRRSVVLNLALQPPITQA
jgi:hypothetical protein